jgi:hypothetical protein
MYPCLTREQKRYKRFLLSKKSDGRQYMVHQQNYFYMCKKHASNGTYRLQGQCMDGDVDNFDILLDSELRNYLPLTYGFKLVDMKPPVVIWMLPDVINDLIREYAADHYESEYKKRRISPRGHKREEPIEVYHR